MVDQGQGLTVLIDFTNIRHLSLVQLFSFVIELRKELYINSNIRKIKHKGNLSFSDLSLKIIILCSRPVSLFLFMKSLQGEAYLASKLI